MIFLAFCRVAMVSIIQDESKKVFIDRPVYRCLERPSLKGPG